MIIKIKVILEKKYLNLLLNIMTILFSRQNLKKLLIFYFLDNTFCTQTTIDKFRSDFWILADYLYQMRVSNDYVACETVIKHVDELLMLMSAMTKDDRFEETINELSRKESVTMCEVLDKVEARGRKEGVISVLISLVKDGILSVSEAAKRADMSEENFKQYLKS
ncbi:hypothetical protein HMPREF1495_0263 [Lachnoanaerobaculum sp. MSX33]|nr:hypothetical protein HMPREF1495_0263 [Lachnoanaerobaculum sp. MSX33]